MRLSPALLVVFLPAVAMSADRRVVFFEKKIRPLLLAKCAQCHGPRKQEAGLRLDNRASAFKGSDYGKIIAPGHPAKSRVIEVVLWAKDDTKMPPKNKLSPAEIALLKSWIKDGAVWPQEETPTESGDLLATHWSFQPVKRPSIPRVKNLAWPRGEIDRFLLARLEQEKLQPSPEADRRTLIRRLFLDLLGVPPTFAEVRTFQTDARPDAYERLVERLLADPRYGERWGRHWLDIARYADTKGYVFQEERRYPFSYTYRDYVIRAFNSDLRYDEFLKQQLAADLIPLSDPAAKAAMGFLTVGRRYRNNVHDIIDDRIDVVMRGMQGLTVTCARCHDHKYDPIPAADYYSLYGVFASSREPDDLPLVRKPKPTPEYMAFAREQQKRKKALDDGFAKAVTEARAKNRKATGEVIVAWANLRRGKPVPKQLITTIRPAGVQRWTTFLAKRGKPGDAVFGPLATLLAMKDAEIARDFNKLLARLKTTGRFNRHLVAALEKANPRSAVEASRAYSGVFAEVHRLGPAARNGDRDWVALREVIFGRGAPSDFPSADGTKYFTRDLRNRVRGLERRLEALKVTHPNAPPRAMVLEQNKNAFNPYVFLRGNAARRGKNVPRRVPAAIARGQRPPFATGGRREMANAIASRQNPLTARVIVNRIWQHHFGRGIVGTPDDFGTRGERPSHPKLLDWLADEFVRRGWSIKAMHRLILTSRAYRQASDPTSDRAQQIDPENRLLSRQNKRRLGFEAMRDSMLAVSGKLDSRPFGQPAAFRAETVRRSVYMLVDRNNVPAMRRVFDYANPDAVTGLRPETTVPQQALFGLNSRFVIAQAQTMGTLKTAELYRRILSREPSEDERRLAQDFLRSQPLQKGLSAAAQFAQILMLSNEFWFID